MKPVYMYLNFFEHINGMYCFRLFTSHYFTSPDLTQQLIILAMLSYHILTFLSLN